jgi:hypothetical protein
MRMRVRTDVNQQIGPALAKQKMRGVKPKGCKAEKNAVGIYTRACGINQCLSRNAVP